MDETFKAKVSRNRRITIPKHLRMRHKLRPGVYLKVELEVDPLQVEVFYAPMHTDGRFHVPSLVSQVLELRPGQIVTCNIEEPTDDEELQQILFKKMQVATAKRP